MKFIVISRPRDGITVPPEQLLKAAIASTERIKAQLAEGRVESVSYTSTNVMYAVVNAESVVDLTSWLVTNPSFFFREFEVEPVMDADEGLQFLKDMASGSLK